MNVIKSESYATKGQATTSFTEDINVKNSRFKSLNWTLSMTNASTHGSFDNSRFNKATHGRTRANCGATKIRALQPSQSQL